MAIDRLDVAPYMAANGSVAADRNITFWRDPADLVNPGAGWRHWTPEAERLMEHHKRVFIWNPYGTNLGPALRIQQRSHARDGFTPDPPHEANSNPPLPWVAEGLFHYLKQIITDPSWEFIFFFGSPSTVFEESGATYTQFKNRCVAELIDTLNMATVCNVTIAFDSTYGHPTSLGGIWTTLGGEGGWIHLLCEHLKAAYGVRIAFEPWIYREATWAHGYDRVISSANWATIFNGGGDGIHVAAGKEEWADNDAGLTGRKYMIAAVSAHFADSTLQFFGSPVAEPDSIDVLANLIAAGWIPTYYRFAPTPIAYTDATSDIAYVAYPDGLRDPATLIDWEPEAPPDDFARRAVAGNVAAQFLRM